MRITKAAPLRSHQLRDAQYAFIDRLFTEANQPDLGCNRRMFAEDFTRLFSPSSRKGGSLFKIVSSDEKLTQRLLRGIEKRHSSRESDSTLCEFVEEIARTLVQYDVAYYFLYDDDEQQGLHIAPFSSIGVVRLFGRYFQWVPKHTVRKWNRDSEELSREIRVLDSAKVMSFRLPKVIRRILGAQNKTLAALDRHQFSVEGFHPEVTHENPNPTNYFDFNAWKDFHDYALFRATRDSGWGGRKYDSSVKSDFFDCHRLIRFRRNQVLLIEAIVSQIGIELSRVSRALSADFTVEISCSDEIPSIERLDDLEFRLTKEEVGFTEVIDYFFGR